MNTGMSRTSLQAVGIHFDYQASVDLLYAWIGEPRAAENVEIESGIYVRIDPTTNRVIGIEVLDCAHRFQRDPSTINVEFAKQLIEAFTRPALERLAAMKPSPPLFSSQQ